MSTPLPHGPSSRPSSQRLVHQVHERPALRGTPRHARSDERSLDTLEALYAQGRCFELRDAVHALGEDDRPLVRFFRAVVHLGFRRHEAARAELEAFLNSTGSPAPYRLDAQMMMGGIAMMTSDYSRGADAFEALLREHSEALSKNVRANVQDLFGVSSQLRQTPPLKVEVAGPVQVPLTRDAAGLVTVPVHFGSTVVPLSLDTAANFSGVSTSTAHRLGLKVLQGSIDLQTASRMASPVRPA